MGTILSIIRKTTLYSTLLLVIACMPLVAATGVFADGSADTQPCTAPPNNQNGVHWPVGSDAATFTYQCTGPNAGYYTNAYYKYDPITTERTALYSPDYSYNCTTGKWSMTEWDYSPAQNTFISSRVTPTINPSLPTGCPVPVTPSVPASSSPTGTTNAGTGSSASGTGTTSLNGSTNTNSAITMTNGIYSNASTGNTFVIGNTTGGSATSGDAQSIANIANLLQSTSNVFGSGTTTFVSNINGDVNGDFMFDPSAALAPTNATPNLAVNQVTTTNAGITNTVDVGATTGNASVARNTTAGDALSGNATAVANLMNLINSTVSAGNSFVGVININGDLNGDILLPPGMINQLLASTDGTPQTSSTNNATTTNTTNESITNNITAAAGSGGAAVSGNTTAGNATSGGANTNVTLFNLTGSQVVGANDLLIFVNVLGHWVGMIVNAPAGSTAASLGGGITQDTTSSPAASSTTTTNLGITNNVNVHANSGDASVTGNTHAGSATTGNANAAVNVLNIANSNLSLSNWFGVLFINVFGNWTGSFGVNTSAGDAPTTPAAPAQTSDTIGASTGSASPSAIRQFATFLSQAANTTSGSASGSSTDQTSTTVPPSSSVLGAKTSQKAAATLPTPDNTAHANLLFPIIGASVAALMLAGERVVSKRAKSR